MSPPLSGSTHIDQERWQKLKRTQVLEKRTVVDLLKNLGKKKPT